MLPLHRPLLDDLAIGAAAGALLALLLVLFVLLRLRSLRRSFRTLDGPEGRESVLEAIARVQAEAAAVRVELAATREALATTRTELADSLRHVAVVRYDAFGDMGGRLSFTAALLDDAGDGLVISAINGRTEGRSYAKGIKGGQGDAPLSPEEQQAVQLAMPGGGSRPVPSGRG